MLPLPDKFDQNEWFIILNSVLGYSWLLFVPKRYPHVISVLVILFTVTVAIMMDHTIATPPLDLYDINDLKKYELFDVITYFMYTPYALLSVYLYDKFNPTGLYFTAYVMMWSLLSVGFEWLAVILNVFKFNGWTMLYSFSFYLFATTLHLKFFQFILRYFKESKTHSFR
ncbi:hypothetical protein [Paenibacillus sp. VTT E-133291]|uniref:hypothetical protein n=1 Tax=Paenibacillus sp. VTT E-133291 TaxID=1986223 RepID=UPI000BA16BDA|nr:hypothetical protein [Paenibacillus sp. VTT E-133291]OZQ91437.1 hypothetical protein CA598_11870 [Paenibacillus sp. VTT E-133291]